jgi:hypothetical protein
LEEVSVFLVITHKNRGDLEARLTSPQGTTSRLMIRNAADADDNIFWTFVSTAFWGENPAGTWTLKVADRAPVTTGRWSSYSATLRMGELIPVLDPPTITLQPANQAVMVGDNAQFAIQASSPFPLTYQWRKDGLNLADGGSIGGATTNALTLTSCDYADQGDYLCVVTNTNGSTPSDAATLTVSKRYAKCDFDHDDDVDMSDFGYLQRCLTESGVPLDPSCQSADLDGDDSVDSEDVTFFVNCSSGPNLPADLYCSG